MVGWWFGTFGTMEFYDFPYIGKFIIPTDELIFFRGVETTNQVAIAKKNKDCLLSWHLG